MKLTPLNLCLSLPDKHSITPVTVTAQLLSQAYLIPYLLPYLLPHILLNLPLPILPFPYHLSLKRLKSRCWRPEATMCIIALISSWYLTPLTFDLL